MAYDFALKSNFVICWNDGITDAQLPHKYLHSVFSFEDVERLGILSWVKNSEAAKELDGLVFSKAVLNLTTASDSHFLHTHPEAKVLLYYVNLEWCDGWHGETLFFHENLRDIVFTSPYTPGRLLVFSGGIPHTMRPQSNVATKFRFTLSLFFDKC